MATYKVGSDGRAQSGLSVGDEVVTAGGTYKITGVNADGSYKSTLSDANQTTGNYAGSYSTGRSSAASTVPDTTDGTVKVANKNVYADMDRNQDLAGQTVWKNGYAITYDANGYATKAVRSESPNYSGHTDSNVTGSGSVGVGENMWTDEQLLTAEDLARIAAIRAQGAAGTISWAEANAQANAIRQGYGYTIDQSGTVVDQMALDRATATQQATGATQYYDKTMGTYQPITNAPQTNVGTVQQQTVTTAPSTMVGTGASGGSISVPITGEGAYPSFQEFLEQTGYDEYSAQTQAAIKAAVEQAVLGYNQQIETANQDTAELARQAYINKMLGEKNLDQQLSASGYAGGMADSQRIAMEGNYQNQLNALEMQRQETVKELENAITNAQLSGDLQTAQELSAYLQELQGQWLSYIQNQQSIANNNYWNEQSLNVQKMEAAYTRALNLLNAGLMPDDGTLSAAGITKSEAQSRLAQILQGYAAELAGEGDMTVPVAQTTTKPTLTWPQTLEQIQAGNLSSNVLKAYQYYMGEEYATETPATQTTGIESASFTNVKRTIALLMARGNNEKAQSVLDTYWDQMSDNQKTEIRQLASSYT